MAKETVTKSDRFYCISLIPDFCKTPVGAATPPLPYTIKGEFKQTSNPSKNVKSHSEPLFLHNKSKIPTVTGDEPGVAKGIKSNTVGKSVESKTFSSSYGSNATKSTQVGRIVWMNDRNTIGQIYERGGQGPKSLQKDFTDKVEQTYRETQDKVNSSLNKLSSEINVKVKDAQQALQDVGQDLAKKLHAGAEQVRENLKPLARAWQGNVSEGVHQFGQKSMDVGGKVALAGLGTTAAGAAASLTVIGAAPGVPMMAAGAATSTVGGGVTAFGAAADSAATVMDSGAAWVLNGKTPDLLGLAGDLAENLGTGLVMRKLGPLGGKLASKAVPKNAITPAPPKAPPKPPPPKPPSRQGADGGKEKPGKKKPADKPPTKCPECSGLAGKPISTKKPIHFGTGEEIFAQTDFVLAGGVGLEWMRVYRSGSETLDWDIFGARWGSPFTASISVCKRGIVYHDATGRSVRLPLIAVGEEFEHKAEGFTLLRDDAEHLSLKWQDGQYQRFALGPNACLPHGYQGVNAMLEPQQAIIVKRYYLQRDQERDGRGYSVERLHDAEENTPLLRLRLDDGRMLEAIRAPSQIAGAMPTIGQVDEVLADGSRICHVRYSYAAEDAYLQAQVKMPEWDRPDDIFNNLPPRLNLVEQSNRLGHSRHYAYRFHLLQRFADYKGNATQLTWTSLAALQEKWAGSEYSQEKLAELLPLHLGNSYQARAISSEQEDGNLPFSINYLEPGITEVTEPDGNIALYHFNEQWLVTEVLQKLPGQEIPVSLGKRRWGKNNQLIAEIDANGRTEQFIYDDASNIICHIDADGRRTSSTYNAANLLTSNTDALGHTSYFEYDAQQRISRVTDALGLATSYAYDARGNLATITDAKGGHSSLAYDAQGNLLSYTDCSGNTSRFAYDENGMLCAQTNALGQTTHYDYDILQRLVGVRYPDKTGEQFTYDAQDNLVRHRDAKGQVTEYSYNASDVLASRKQSDGSQLDYLYDKALRLQALVNENREHYRFAYHPQGWLKSETDFAGKTTEYAYDAAGQLKSSDSQGQKTDYLRDAGGQLIAKMNADGQVRYAYDALGRLIAVAAPEAEQRFVYDPLGRLLEERNRLRITMPQVQPIPTPIHYKASAKDEVTEYDFVLQHRYDELGNLIQTTLPNGRKLDHLRYGSGHWHGSLWQGHSLLDIERDALHRETGRELVNGWQSNRSYDAQSRLSKISLISKTAQQNHGNGQPIERQERHYQYDLAGNLNYIHDNKRGLLQYQYDPVGRLLSAIQPGLSEKFAFDPAGNILDQPSTTDAARPLQEQALSEKPQNLQLPKVTHNLLQVYLGQVYEYDIQGNTVRKQAKNPSPGTESLEYEYDAANRLIKATKRGPYTEHIAHYQYDAFHRRIAKSVIEQSSDSYQGPVVRRSMRTTLFVWDGDVLRQEIQLPDMYSAEGQHSDKLQTISYLHEPDSFIPLAKIVSEDSEEIYASGTAAMTHIGDWDLPKEKFQHNAHCIAWQNHQANQRQVAILEQRCEQARKAKDTRYFYQCDHLGTPLELQDEAGKTIWAARYRAWGRVWQLDAKDVEQPLRFQGQYFDAETGLHYNRYRYYDPEAARFVTQDPIGLLGGINVYQYAPNGVVWIDPLGLKMRSAKTVRFSQNGYSTSFSNGGCVNELAYHLKDSPEFAETIEPIRLVRFKDLPGDVQAKLASQGAKSNMVFSLDNRRLAAAKQAGVKVNSRWATPEEIKKDANLRRFSTTNAGKTICPN